MRKNKLTRRELIEITGVQFHRIDYLRMTGKLPIVQKSSGQGGSTGGGTILKKEFEPFWCQKCPCSRISGWGVLKFAWTNSGKTDI